MYVHVPTKWYITYNNRLINKKTVADFVNTTADGKTEPKMNSATAFFFQFGRKSGKV
jgi:hypothetical protein